MKKLAIASAAALMFVGSAHAINFDQLATDITSATASTTSLAMDIKPVDTIENVTTALGKLLVSTTPTVTVVGGAMNTGLINGAIDISGTNVSVGALIGNVSATANAITSDAYAIAGAKLSTTVIGAMNSSTIDLAAKTTTQTANALATLNVATLANQGGAVSLTTPTLVAAIPTTFFGLDTIPNGGFFGGATASSDILKGSTDSTQLSLAGLVSNTSNNLTNTVTELQNMNVFNGAVNVAALDAGIKIAANVDTNAWFLNPQTGIVNLSNISMATTAIGAMNSSITKLGVSLAK